MNRFCFSFVILLTLANAVKAEFDVVNLVTDDSAAHSALLTDSSLKNAWGISYTPTGPFWLSANGSGVSEVYQESASNPPTTPTKVGLTVTIPGDGSVTGQVYNSTTGFNADLFLFVSEDGTVSGWRGALGTTAETLQAGSPANVYKGTALATNGANTYLYSANFRAGTIDVIKGSAADPNLSGSFSDPNIPAGYAPFNIQKLNGNLYVTYAKQDPTLHDDVAGAGFGYVNVFDTNGILLNHVDTPATLNLNSPWALAIAPSSLGSFAGDLLVGNFGDGTINAYNPTTYAFLGKLPGPGGQPLVIDGLWALSVGNNGGAGSSQNLYFSAGPDGESHGLFGVIVPEPSTFALLGMGVLGVVVRAWRRRKVI